MAELTKNDLKNIKEVFTEALEPFAQAIQKDFKGLDTKVDVNTMQLDNKISKLDFELREVKKNVEEIKRNSYELFTKLDEFISLYKETKQELTILREQMRRLEDRLAKLEGSN